MWRVVVIKKEAVISDGHIDVDSQVIFTSGWNGRRHGRRGRGLRGV